MSPFEAGQVVFEEPNWHEVFEEHKKRWPKLPDYLACDSAFEQTLRDWRRFHWTPSAEGKRTPAAAVDGIIALAHLGIFPPRSLAQDISRDGKLYEPDIGDEHMWLQVAGRAWRIVGIEDRMLLLDSFGETKQIDLNKAKWASYIEAATKAISQS